MVRTLLALLLGVLLFAGIDGRGADVPGDAVVDGVSDAADQATTGGAAAGGDGCCPPRPGQTDEDGDCCDFDLGQCCANGVVAPAPAVATIVHPRPATVDVGVGMPHHLLRTRATGPPPTPPPIG